MSLQACADLVARADPRRFRAAMAAPMVARKVLLPLYAFNIEVTRAPWVTPEPMIAEMRLQWWRDALEEIAEGRARRHEVVDALGFLTPDMAAQLDALIAARRWDIYRDAHEDAAALQAYLDATGTGLIAVAVAALGGEMTDVLRHLGRGAALARYLLAVPDLEARGRVPLVDGRAEAVAALAAATVAAMPRRITAPRNLRPALFETAGARAVLGRAARAPGLVGQGGLAPSDLSERMALIRAASFGRV